MSTKPEIHPTAIVEDGARIAAGVRIGPFCHVTREVTLGEGVELVSHVVVAGRTSIGARTRIFPFASIGHQPQDLKYHGEPSTLTVGSDCLIREGVTMNPGTEGGGMETIVGDRCTFLANSHVGHDCRIGSGVICSNNVMLAGHLTVGDFAGIGGGAAVIQFTRVGAHSYLGGMSGLENDLIPYGMAMRQPRPPFGAQHRRPAAARLLARGYPLAATRLPAPVRRRRDAGGAYRGRGEGIQGPPDRHGDRGLHPRPRQARAVRPPP